jgi:hypothetical protein
MSDYQLIFRYVQLLYAQPANFSVKNIPVPSTRKDFNTTDFENKIGLGPPIGGDLFLVGDAASGPSSTNTENATMSCPTTTTVTASPSSKVASSASSLHAGINFNFNLFLIVWGLVLYHLDY